MLPAAVNAPPPDRSAPPSAAQLLTLWRARQTATGRGNTSSDQAVRMFLARWPDPGMWAQEPLPVRLALSPSATSLVMMLMCRGWLRPGWDWLVRRKLSSFWREIVGTPLAADMTRFVDTAITVGFTPTQARQAASQSVSAEFEHGKQIARLESHYDEARGEGGNWKSGT